MQSVAGIVHHRKPSWVNSLKTSPCDGTGPCVSDLLSHHAYHANSKTGSDHQTCFVVTQDTRPTSPKWRTHTAHSFCVCVRTGSPFPNLCAPTKVGCAACMLAITCRSRITRPSTLCCTLRMFVVHTNQVHVQCSGVGPCEASKAACDNLEKVF